MDDHSCPPPSPKSPFLKYLADESPTHFDSKYIDEELAKPNSALEMVLKEVEAPNKKKKPIYSTEWLPMVRLIVVFSAFVCRPFVRIIPTDAPGASACRPRRRALDRPRLAWLCWPRWRVILSDGASARHPVDRIVPWAG